MSAAADSADGTVAFRPARSARGGERSPALKLPPSAGERKLPAGGAADEAGGVLEPWVAAPDGLHRVPEKAMLRRETREGPRGGGLGQGHREPLGVAWISVASNSPTADDHKVALGLSVHTKHFA